MIIAKDVKIGIQLKKTKNKIKTNILVQMFESH